MAPNFTNKGPGKLSERLLVDLLDYDISRIKPNRKTNILIDPAPKVRPDKLPPHRTNPDDCHHHLCSKPSQTDLWPSESPIVEGAASISSSFCTKCLHHFQVCCEFADPQPDVIFSPCRLGSDFPMHHFQHVDSTFRMPDEIQKDGDGNWREMHIFTCSAYHCPALVTIRIAPPRLTKQQMALLTDMQKTYQRGLRMIEREGERMAGMNPSHPAAVLNVLQTYLTHALQQSTGDRKRIVAKNKRFLMTFGDDCQALLEYLGFTYRTETLEVDGIRDEQAFWLLPEVAPKDSVEQKTNRQFLEDVICEVQQRLIERPRQEREESKVEFTWAQQSAIKDIRTALGCFGFPLDSRPITLDGDEHPHYASLGAVGTFADELIVFAYERQRECDPNNAPYYLECLKGIGDGRHSEIITEEYVKRLSMGEPTLTEVEAAYKFFALNPNQLGPHSDDHIIGVYKSYIDAAPKQKQDAKAALLKIGKARESNEIIEVAEDKEMSYKEALEFLGVVEDTPSDSIEAQAVALGLDDDKGRVAKALAIIGDHRGDFGLQMAAANMDGDASGPRLTLSEAYKRLQIHDENIADEAVFAYYQTLCAEGGAGSKDSYKDALRVIAKARNSQLLFAKMADVNAVIQAPKSASDQPVGLENIGNTCYLNSLLQYYYTVKAVRDVVMNFDDYRMPLNTENILKKRVGGRSITKGEIVKSQKFVEELRFLYEALKTVSSQSVKPTQDLAELTLFSTATEANFRRASIASPTRSSMSSFMGPELPPLYPPPDHAPPPVPARPPPILEETPEDVDMVGSGDYHEGHTRDTSSEATLVDVNELQDDTDMANKPPASDPSATVAAPLTSSPKPIDEDTVMVNGAIALMSPPATPERGPPVPPRGRPTDINTTTTADDEMSRQERLTFGAQQDVTEVIGNVMFRLQCAIKPTAIDPKYGEQTDIIRETFYGSNAMYLKKDNKYDIKVEDWANIIVFPSSEGPRDVYEALDVVFDEQVVEIDKTTTTQFASIKTLPPIVQIQIQRTAFDPVTQTASKNTNPIKFEETLYLDRYMDDDKVLARRQSAWQWKSRLRDLEARKKAIENTKANVPLLAVLQATKNYIHELEAQDAVVDISPNLSGMLEDRGATIQRELQGINVEIAKLKQKLQDQFTDLRQHRYRLQAVFIHRGTNQAGHYWIYIYDFARDVWREYNDERVFIVDDRKRIFEQQGGATPYYLVYVRDDIKEDLVEAVHRDLAPSPTVKPVKDTEMLDVERVVEVGNGVQHVEHAEHVEYAEHVENADKHSQTLRRSTQEISAMKLGSASPERPGEERKGG